MRKKGFTGVDWFLNSILLNMETWHKIVDNTLKDLKKLDNYLNRKIISAYSKVIVNVF